VNLLGVSVTALVTLDPAEHGRRAAVGVGAVMDPALLDRLLDLPPGISVADPAIWAETAEQPEGIVERDNDGRTVTRRLVPPLTIDDVIVTRAAGHELRAVRDASLFAAFTRRWIAGARGLPDAIVFEAKLTGVGVKGPQGKTLLEAEAPVLPVMDGWSWLLQEKSYQQWLSEPRQDHVTASQVPATGEANATRAP
jgi:hypothetical protein